MSTIKKTKLGEKIKKQFNRQNIFFTAGLILLFLAGVIWLLNGNGRQVLFSNQTAQAATCTPSGNNKFCENWVVNSILGDVGRYDWGGASVNVVTDRKEQCPYQGQGNGGCYVVPNSRAAKGVPVLTYGDAGLLISSAPGVPVWWQVNGAIKTSTTGTSTYDENWVAKEVIGAAWSYEGSRLTETSNACISQLNYSDGAGMYFAVPGSPAATSCSSNDGILNQSDLMSVTKWSVDGSIQ